MKNKVINLFDNKKLISNEGKKYSALLQDFIQPFMYYFKDFEYVEDIFEFSIDAWNMANIHSQFSKKERKKILASFPKGDGDDLLILKKMLDYKHEKFSSYSNFIIDYEIIETANQNETVLNIVTQPKEIYLANMVEGIESEKYLHSAEEEFEENFINRSAIILKVQQPFIDWISNLYPDIIGETLEEPLIYLIDDIVENLEPFLKKKYDKFFKMVLEDWHTNKKEWPQRRNYKMFTQWFQVDISGFLYDTGKKPILKSY